MTTTFSVSDKAAEEFQLPKWKLNPKKRTNALKAVPLLLPHYQRNNCTGVLQGSMNLSPKTRISRNNGFVNTVLDCYKRHLSLVLRPDDIWAAITTQFSFYVNRSPEGLREKIVHFEGTKGLTLNIAGTLRSTSSDLFLKLISKELDRNLIDPEVKAWLTPSFSTTTNNDLMSMQAVFMASANKYFDHKCGFARGIPFVTLEGTVADWEDIRSRLKKLKEYKLAKWYEMLRPILDQFVKAKKGQADVHFWKRICDYHEEVSSVSYLSGWITAFCVFDADGNWQGDSDLHEHIGADPSWPALKTEDIPTGVVELEIKINEHGTLNYSTMFAGHIAYEIQKDGKTLKPTIGWVICLKSGLENEDKLRLNAMSGVTRGARGLCCSLT